MSQEVLVLGCGTAAVAAIKELRSRGYAGDITVLCDSQAAPYSPVLTSYYAGGQLDYSKLFAWGEDFCARMGVTFVGGAGAKVQSLDGDQHVVTTVDGTQYSYQLCLIATGARPWIPDNLPLEDALLILRTLQDAQEFKSVLEAKEGSLVILGTSMVALKAAEAARAQGWQVTLIGRSSHILTRGGHPLATQRFQELLAKQGISFVLNCPDLLAQQTLLKKADAVLVAYGVLPNTDFAPAALLDDGKHFVVDSYQRTALPNVFAAGDCCSCLDVLVGTAHSFGLWAPAYHQGRVAGAAMASQLLGILPQSVPEFPGAISASTIHVGDSFFVSVGDMAEGENCELEVIDTHGELLLKMWEVTSEEDRRLVGFNVVSNKEQNGRDAFLLNTVGSLRQEVLNGCWDAASLVKGAASGPRSLDGTERSLLLELYPELGQDQLCRHCLLAPCVEACPAGALERDEENVLVNQGRCIGCRSCALACTFDVPRFGEDGLMCKQDIKD